MPPSDLPEATLRFVPLPAENCGNMPGRVHRCVVVVAGRDVGELQVSNLRYEQEGDMSGKWWVSLFADRDAPLSGTARFSKPPEVAPPKTTQPDHGLSADLHKGDVLISPRGIRWTVTGYSPRGKLQAERMEGLGASASWWWQYRSHLPNGWKLERYGELIL